MAAFIYYVNPDSAASGDGTTDTLSGGNHAYQTLNAAVTARAGTHGSGNTITYRCSGNGSNFIDSTGVVLSSHTEDHVTIEGYNGNYSGYNTGSAYDNTAYYALEVATASVYTIDMGIGDVTIRNLQCDNTSATNFFVTIRNAATVSNVTINNCRVKCSKTGSSKKGGVIVLSGVVDNVDIYNNICHGNGNTTASNLGIEPGSGSSGTPSNVSNNTIYNVQTGIKTHNFFYYYFYNNAIVGCGNDWLFVGSENITASHNADSADGDTPGTSNTTCVATTGTDFTNVSTGDFTVVSGGNLDDAGTSNAQTPSTDIIGTSRA